MKNVVVSVSLLASLAGPAVALAGSRPDVETVSLGQRAGRPPATVFAFATAFADELDIAPRTLSAIAAAEERARGDFQRLRLVVLEARNAVEAGADASLLEVAHETLVARRRALRQEISGMLTPAQRQDLETLMGLPATPRG